MDENRKESITIHVLNAWNGDSILVELGSGVWGVVDSNRITKEAPIPAVEFLKQEERKGNLKQIAFVALTHPHLDHFLGMPDIFAHFKEKIEAFWDFGRDARPMIAFFLRCLRGEAYQSGLELLRFYEGIYTLKKEGSLRHLSMGSFQLMSAPSPDLTIWALSPSRGDLDRYFQSIELRKEDQEVKMSMIRLDQNDVSAVLLINFHEHFILLGSDATGFCWEQILIDPRLAALRERNRDAKPVDALKSHIVKVSHHGSKSSLCPNLWPSLAIPQVTVAAISAEGKVNPHREVIREILQHGVGLYCTNRPQIAAVPRGHPASREYLVNLMPQTIAAWEEWNVHLDAHPYEIASSHITIRIDSTGAMDTRESRHVFKMIDEENALFLT